MFFKFQLTNIFIIYTPLSTLVIIASIMMLPLLILFLYSLFSELQPEWFSNQHLLSSNPLVKDPEMAQNAFRIQSIFLKITICDASSCHLANITILIFSYLRHLCSPYISNHLHIIKCVIPLTCLEMCYLFCLKPPSLKVYLANTKAFFMSRGDT